MQLRCSLKIKALESIIDETKIDETIDETKLQQRRFAAGDPERTYSHIIVTVPSHVSSN